MNNKKSGKGKARKIAAHIVLIVILCISLFPLYWMFNTAVKSSGEILSPHFIPKNPTIQNFIEVITGTGMAVGGLTYARNSLIVSTLAMLLSLCIGALAAYGLARSETKWSSRISMWILSTRMFPPAATIIPIFLMFRSLRLIDTYTGLVIAYVAYNLPFVTWMLKGFFVGIPKEIEESARVEGCSDFGAFVRISLPLIRPGLAVAGLFAFVYSWNEFLFALILTRVDVSTIPIQIASYQGVKGLIWGNMMAAAIVASVPGIILAFLAQKHLVRGLTLGAVKG